MTAFSLQGFWNRKDLSLSAFCFKIRKCSRTDPHRPTQTFRFWSWCFLLFNPCRNLSKQIKRCNSWFHCKCSSLDRTSRVKCKKQKNSNLNANANQILFLFPLSYLSIATHLKQCNQRITAFFDLLDLEFLLKEIKI